MGGSIMDNAKVLVVEDENFIREAVTDYLELKGYEEVFATANGQEAIEILEKEDIDFVFLDVQLADEINGMDILKGAKEKFPKTKIIMMSAYHQEHGAEARRLGAHAFLKKPFNIKQVLEVLEKDADKV